MSSAPIASTSPHFGFASEERLAAAKAFLKAHASYGFLGNFLNSCDVLQSPEAPAVAVVTGGEKTVITIPAALDRYTDAPIGAANPLSAAIVDEAGRFLIRQMTRTSRPAPEASASPASPASPEEMIGEKELGQLLVKEGLGDLAGKLFERRTAPLTPAAPSAPSASPSV